MSDNDGMEHISRAFDTVILNIMPETRELLNEALRSAIQQSGGIEQFSTQTDIPVLDFYSYRNETKNEISFWRKLMPFIKKNLECLLDSYEKNFIEKRVSQLFRENHFNKDLNDNLKKIAMDLEEDEVYKKCLDQLIYLMTIFPEMDENHACN